MLREEHSERQERLRLIPVEEKIGSVPYVYLLPPTFMPVMVIYDYSDVSEISLSPGGEERKAAQALQEELARS